MEAHTRLASKRSDGSGVHPGSVVILDFGGQYAHLIANRVRRLGAFSEIRVAETKAQNLRGAAGIILSGGPQSVYEKGSPQADPKILELDVPVLGLCYGHQWLARQLGGSVRGGKVKEYGSTEIAIAEPSSILKNVAKKTVVWMSHGDEVATTPEGFSVNAGSATCAVAAMADEVRRFYGLQFHVEVTHTTEGMKMLENFVKLCGATPWKIDDFVAHVSLEIQKQIGPKKKVFMLVSGGVDSTVAFTLLNKVLSPKRVQGLIVDTGLMRKGEVAAIIDAFRDLGVTNLRVEDASDEFFADLHGVIDPEAKRKAIGEAFLSVQRRVSEEAGLGRVAGAERQGGGEWLLGQGTIYPDTIESKGTKHADHIKTHHNRVGAIQRMIDQGLVVEHLKELYKDEVRRLGELLGLPHDLVWRHPFPGPGLGVRILCADSAVPNTVDADVEKQRALHMKDLRWRDLPIRSVGVQGDGRTYRHALVLFSRHPCKITSEHLRLATAIPNAVHCYNRVLLCTSHDEKHMPDFVCTPGFVSRERADLLREADAIVTDEIRAADLYEKIWQMPVVLLPVGASSGNQSVVLRPVDSVDAMTADPVVIPQAALQQITRRILDLPGIDAVFVDLTSKPPGTIEWE